MVGLASDLQLKRYVPSSDVYYDFFPFGGICR